MHGGWKTVHPCLPWISNVRLYPLLGSDSLMSCIRLEQVAAPDVRNDVIMDVREL